MKRVRYDNYAMGELIESLDNPNEDKITKRFDSILEKMVEMDKKISILLNIISEKQSDKFENPASYIS